MRYDIISTLSQYIIFRTPGVQGAKALMAIPMAVGDRVEVSSSGCNIDIVDPNSGFNLSHPCGSYNLDLSKPYDRAVSFAILRLVAGHQKIDITGIGMYCIVLYCIVLYCTVLYYTVLYCTILHCTVPYFTVLYCIVLYCTVLYCTILHCTVLVLYCSVLYSC